MVHGNSECRWCPFFCQKPNRVKRWPNLKTAGPRFSRQSRVGTSAIKFTCETTRCRDPDDGTQVQQTRQTLGKRPFLYQPPQYYSCAGGTGTGETCDRYRHRHRTAPVPAPVPVPVPHKRGAKKLSSQVRTSRPASVARRHPIPGSPPSDRLAAPAMLLEISAQSLISVSCNLSCVAAHGVAIKNPVAFCFPKNRPRGTGFFTFAFTVS